MANRSWVTQRLANRFPMQSDVRVRKDSIGQQYMAPVASAIEDLYEYSLNEVQNNFVTLANLDAVDVLHAVRLPAKFQFGQDLRNVAYPMNIAPYVKVEINGVDSFLEPAADNSLQNFWYDALPKRITDSGTSVAVNNVIDETTLSGLEDATINAITNPSRLYITVTGCDDFIDDSKRLPYAYIRLHGTLVTGAEASEMMIIPYNGIFETRNIWYSLSSIQYYGLTPDTGTVKVEHFSFNHARYVDRNMLDVGINFEKLMYHALGSHDFNDGTYSTHELKSVIAGNLDLLHSGIDSLQTVIEMELGYDNSGTFTNVSLNDIALQPFTNRIYGIDNTHLYIFSPKVPQFDFKYIASERTPGAKMIIDFWVHDRLRDDEIELSPYWRLPVKRILKHRWSVIKPSGDKAYLNMAADECTASAAWIPNQHYWDLAFGPFVDANGDKISKQLLTYTLSSRGTYKFFLEVMYEDETIEKDALAIQAHYKEALKRISLPATLQNATGLAFDSDQYLWFLKSGNALKADLHYDNFMVDFERKIIYMRDEYDSVEVIETGDWTD